MGEAKAAVADRPAGVRAIDCNTGKPGGRLFSMVRSTVTPEVTLLVTPVSCSVPVKACAVSGKFNVPLELTGTVVSTTNGEDPEDVGDVEGETELLLPPPPQAATATIATSNGNSNRVLSKGWSPRENTN